MEIRQIRDGEEAAVLAAGNLFDGSPVEADVRAFLDQPNHHLLFAYVDGVAVGFVSGVEIYHPDKTVEMFLYELGVDEAFRRRGIGKELVDALRMLAIERGCRGMWVLTERENEAAVATYKSAGADSDCDQLLLEWTIPTVAVSS